MLIKIFFLLLFVTGSIFTQTIIYKGIYNDKNLTLKISEDDPRVPKVFYTIDDLTYAGAWRLDGDGIIRGKIYAFDSFLGEYGGDITIVTEGKQATVYFSGYPKVLIMEEEEVAIPDSSEIVENKTGEELDNSANKEEDSSVQR